MFIGKQAMYSTSKALGLILISFGFLSSFAAYAQQGKDCRPHKDFPSLDGHWKDDLNGQEIDITTDRRGFLSSFTVLATYSSPEKNCRNPDVDGKPVPFQTDFQAATTDHGPEEISGNIYWCDTATRDGKTYTTGIGSGAILLKESKDGMTLSGNFHGRNGQESISFTRLSKPELGQVIVRATADARIYAEASTNSSVKYTPPSGTKLMIEDAKLDANGNATWYFVTNGAGDRTGPNNGWIPAEKVVCPSSSPGPVSLLSHHSN
jgi:hypothetical protein